MNVIIKQLLFNTQQDNYKHEELGNKITRFVNDSIKYGFGAGHIEPTITNLKLQAGCRVSIDNNWYDIKTVVYPGTDFNTFDLYQNPPMGRVRHVYGSEIRHNLLKLNYPHAENNLLGTGKDGSLTIYNNTIVNTYYYLLDNVSKGSDILKLNSIDGLSVGDELLIHQTQDSLHSNSGKYETSYVHAIDNNNVYLSAPLTRSYYTGQFNCINSCVTQVVRIPNYTTLTINSGYIIPSFWNGYNGGIVIFRCLRDLYIYSGGIFTSGYGFRAGAGASIYWASWPMGGGIIIQTSPPYSGEGIFGRGRAYDNLGYGGSGGCSISATCSSAGASYGGLGARGRFLHKVQMTYGLHTEDTLIEPYEDGDSYTSGIYGDQNLANQIHLGAASGGMCKPQSIVSGSHSGASGGGIIILASNQIRNYGGKILSEGLRGCDGILDADQHINNGTGAGAGGSIYLMSDLFLNYGTISTKGGDYSILTGSLGGVITNSGGRGANGRATVETVDAYINNIYNTGTLYYTPSENNRFRVKDATYPANQYYLIQTTDQSQIDISQFSKINSIKPVYFTPIFNPSQVDCRILISFDGRFTWFSFIDENWTEVNVDQISISGMSLSTINNITRSQWNSPNVFKKLSNTLDFAISLKSTVNECYALESVTINGNSSSRLVWGELRPHSYCGFPSYSANSLFGVGL